MFERIVNYYFRNKSNKKLIKEGLVGVGNNFKIEDLEIIFSAAKKVNLNAVIIGEDCDLSGKIIIYNASAKIKIGNRDYIGPNTTLFCN